MPRVRFAGQVEILADEEWEIVLEFGQESVDVVGNLPLSSRDVLEAVWD